MSDDVSQTTMNIDPHLARYENGDIVIRITPDALRFASENGILNTWFPAKGDFRSVRVTDLDKWRDAILRALNREAENGDTPVHLMLDDCLRHAAEQGEEGVEIEGVDY